MKSQPRPAKHRELKFPNHQGDRQRQQPVRRRQASAEVASQSQPIPFHHYQERRDRRQAQYVATSARQTSTHLRQQQRIRERRRVQIWETAIAASFTVIWAAIAVSGIVKLHPVRQNTNRSLTTLTTEVEQLQARVNRARRKVELGLDPTQSETAIRESLNYVPFNQLGIIFEEPPSPSE
ncbi:MAG: hypothetical protein AB4050_01100 [Synechococcus sp.]